tara:strand:- start:535 stop:936 length:402 start_codon:yes stop_codon:yes gene_type:complete
MAQLRAGLTLTSTNLTSDSLNLSMSKLFSVAGDVRVFRKVIAASEGEVFTNQLILDASKYGKCYVLFRNLSVTATEIITIGLADANDDGALATVNISLGSEEFAFYPWNSSLDVVADAASGSPVLEVGIFEAV